MLCIKEELGHMGLSDDLPYKSDMVDPVTDSSAENTCQNRWPPGGPGFGHASGKQIGWMDGLLGCMRPVLSLIGKAAVMEMKNKHTEADWEIPFESMTDLEWLGSGAQGAVFSAKLKNQIVAVKKVRDVRETDIKQLRKLDHDNIIKFK